MFEHFVQQMQKSNIEIQNLLTPYLLKISREELLFWEDAQQKLKEIGFDTTLFDEETVAIQSHPVLIKNPENFLRPIHALTARIVFPSTCLSYTLGFFYNFIVKNQALKTKHSISFFQKWKGLKPGVRPGKIPWSEMGKATRRVCG